MSEVISLANLQAEVDFLRTVLVEILRNNPDRERIANEAARRARAATPKLEAGHESSPGIESAIRRWNNSWD